MRLSHEHEYVDELIPWFVNGTLPKEERLLVERHILSCLPCRRAVEQERRIRELMVARPHAGVDVEEGFRRLAQRIDDPGHTVARRPSPRHAPARAAWTGWAIAAGVVLAVGGLSWYLASLPVSPSAEFATLAAPGESSQRLDVVLTEGLTAAERARLFSEFDGRVIAGPTEIGRYTLEFGGADSTEKIDALLERLRSDPRIRFAGRSFAAGDAER
jgi:anti-sigma factor RsiW